MSAAETDRIAEMAAATTEQLQAYCARLRALPAGLTTGEQRGLVLAINELDRRGEPEVRP